jgi:hypothetical protein
MLFRIQRGRIEKTEENANICSKTVKEFKLRINIEIIRKDLIIENLKLFFDDSKSKLYSVITEYIPKL